jgi:hypothetical protein
VAGGQRPATATCCCWGVVVGNRVGPKASRRLHGAHLPAGLVTGTHVIFPYAGATVRAGSNVGAAVTAESSVGSKNRRHDLLLRTARYSAY